MPLLAAFYVACAAVVCAQQAPAGLITMLYGPEPRARVGAARELVRLGGEAVPLLVQEMKNYRRRPAARNVIQAMGPGAVPSLVALLNESDLRPEAAASLPLVIGAESAEHVPALLKCLERPESANSCGMALLLAAPKAHVHAKAVASALGAPHAEARVYAAAALGRMQARPQEAVAPLTTALRDHDAAVRLEAIKSLRRYGSKARSAAAALRVLKTDLSRDVRIEAGRALKSIDD